MPATVELSVPPERKAPGRASPAISSATLSFMRLRKVSRLRERFAVVLVEIERPVAEDTCPVCRSAAHGLRAIRLTPRKAVRGAGMTWK